MDNIENKEWNLREEALEKEVLRLKKITKKQSVNYSRLKRIAIFQFLFFTLLLLMFLFFGVISWPESNQNVLSNDLTGFTIDSVAEVDTLNWVEDSIRFVDSHKGDLLVYSVPENGILFSVQIGAFADVNMSSFQLNMLTLKQYNYQHINQYTVGLFSEYNEAVNFQSQIIEMGFDDAFIIATRYGVRLSVNEALSIQTEDNS